MRKKTVVFIGSACVGVVVLAGIAAFIAMRSIDLEKIKTLLADQVQAATGRTLAIKGPVEIELGLVPRLVVNEVSLSNPAKSSRPDMVRIKRFEMEVALSPLLKRQLQVNRLLLNAPDIVIETESKGPGNLDFTAPGTAKQPETTTAPTQEQSSFSFAFNEVRVENATLTWLDRDSKTTENITLKSLNLQPDKANASLLALRLAATVREQNLEVSGTMGGIDTLLGGKPWPVKLEALVKGIRLKAEGQIADVKAVQGIDLALGVQGGELSEVLRLAGVQQAALPPMLGPFILAGKLRQEGKQFTLSAVDVQLGTAELATVRMNGVVKDLTGSLAPALQVQVDCANPATLAKLAGTEIALKGPVALSSKISGSKTQWSLAELVFKAGASDLKGNLQLHVADHPRISGQLSSTILDVNEFLPASTAAVTEAAKTATNAPGDKGRLFSADPLPLAALRMMDADIKAQVGKLMLPGRQLSDVNLSLQLKNGHLTLSPFRFGLAGGVFDGGLHLDAGAKTPTLGLQINGRGFELGQLQANGPIAGGRSDLKVDVKSRGDSMRALMATASGETWVSVGEGRLQNKALNWAAGDFIFQVLGAINPFTKSEDHTAMSCAAVRFVLKDGLATAEDGIALRTDKVDVIGSGTVNLRDEELDLGIKPRARGGVGLSITTPLAGLVRVSGTLAKPSMGIDAVGTLKTAASIGAGVATGGLSTLGELLVDKVAADSDPCSTALGKKK